MSMSELDTYRERVQTAKVTRSPDIIFNSTTSHAAILIEEMFHDAQFDVGMLCRSLNPAIYERADVMNAIQGFLERPGSHLTVMTQTQISAGHKLVDEIFGSDRYSARVTFKGPNELSSIPPFNFIVSDGRAYRFERDPESHTAVASFNGRNLAAKLAELVDDLVGRPSRFGGEAA